jgi:predicted RNase H-related nuclease YkuK (DUF458 family)
MFPSSKTEIAQMAARMVVSANVASFASNQIEKHSDFDQDSLTNSVASSAIGWYAGMKLKPVTDKAVVATRDFVASHKPSINLRRKSES